MRLIKYISLIALCASVCGCRAESVKMNGVTEYRLSDFGGTMAYASDSEDASLDLQSPGQPVILSEYSTKFNTSSKGRAENIALAAKGIDQVIVFPGEEFSFNDTLGPTNKASGYKRSKIFVKGKELDGYGGGICQVSSTLYNAVYDAGLSITERHPHSRTVNYVPKNKDAAVSYGGIDFKFVNEYAFPIKINSFVIDGEITINVEGL